MAWRYYAHRPGSTEWLDTNVQLSDVEMVHALSGPASGSALAPTGLSPVRGGDGHLMWARMRTVLLAEEDGDLRWGGVCTAANPSPQGTKLEFIGPRGWLERVDYSDHYKRWRINAFDVVRDLVAHSQTKPGHLPMTVSNNNSIVFLGDPQPPNRPRQPNRRKGETVKEYRNSKRYDAWKKADSEWNEKYGKRRQFEIGWFEAPYVGEEIDTLAKENGFEYRESFRWINRNNGRYEFKLEIADGIRHRRHDIKFMEGVNIAKALDPKDGDDEFANRVIALGAGEGRTMARAEVGEVDGRLYQAAYTQYKNIKDEKRLRDLAQADLKILSSSRPEIDGVEVWDTPGYSDMSTLRVGDEVLVESGYTLPAVSQWVRVTEIARRPQDSKTTISLERAS